MSLHFVVLFNEKRNEKTHRGFAQFKHQKSLLLVVSPNKTITRERVLDH